MKRILVLLILIIAVLITVTSASAMATTIYGDFLAAGNSWKGTVADGISVNGPLNQYNLGMDDQIGKYEWRFAISSG